MAKRQKDIKTIWHYADWLLNTGRITKEEHAELYRLADKLEEETFDLCLPK
jgi:hypothetical protein